MKKQKRFQTITEKWSHKKPIELIIPIRLIGPIGLILKAYEQAYEHENCV